jgi:glycosyltransferase involved in cell wall biosynthesis
MTEVDCLILTTAHHREDARLNRHVAALRRAGVSTGLLAIDASRLVRFAGAAMLVYRTLRAVRPASVVFPDPELFVAGPLVANRMGVRSVLDVHEDYRAVAVSRDWIPRPLRAIVGSLAAASTSWGRKVASATIVAAPHLARPGDIVVPNIPDISFFPSSDIREQRKSVVYVGDVSESRGVLTMLEIIKGIPGLTLELIGPITADIEHRVRKQTQTDGTADRVIITGRLPYTEAWERAAGAIAGLAMLQPTPAYNEAIPSKLWEYMAVGIPIIASDLPAQRSLIEESGGGVVVSRPAKATIVLQDWLDNPDSGREIGAAGHEYYRSIAVKSGVPQTLVGAITGR